jgi:Na+/phosphate symporter
MDRRTGVPPVVSASNSSTSMSDRPARNPFFPLTAMLSAVFVLTVLALVASMFSDQRAPLARLLDAHGTTLVVIEVAAILLVGLLALVVDRVQAVRRQPASAVTDDPPHPRTTNP